MSALAVKHRQVTPNIAHTLTYLKNAQDSGVPGGSQPRYSLFSAGVLTQ